VYVSAVAPYIASSTDNPALPNAGSNARPLYLYGSNVTYDARFGHHYFITGNVGIGASNPGYRLEVSGAIYSSGDITAFSDKRMKDDLKPIINALDKVEKMQGYTYVRKDYDALNEKMGRRHIGFVAQELVDVVPEAVLYDEGSDRFSVNYGSLVAVCVEAIKELRRENRELRDIIANLL
jgi:hypothetical protein